MKDRWPSVANVTGLFIATLAVSVLARISWIIHPAIMGGDESTYFVVASRMLHGELPYTTTFDNKPPLAEAPQALAILFFGHNLISLRVAAALILGIAAFLLASVAFSNRMTWLRFPISIASICLYSTIDQGAVWQAELNAVLIFSIALWLIIRKLPPFWIGLCIGLIPLMRTNWIAVSAVLAFGVTVWPWPVSLKRVMALAAGICAPVLFVVLPYLLTGQMQRLISGAVILPMARQEATGFALPSSWAAYALIAAALLVLAAVIHRQSGRADAAAFDAILVLSLAALTLVAAYQSPDFEHHTLQVVMFIPLALGRAVAASLAAQTFQASRKPFRNKAIIIVLISSIWLTAAYSAIRLIRFEVATWPAVADSARISEARYAAVAGIEGIQHMTVWQVGGPDLLYRLDKAPIHPLASEACLQANGAIRGVFYGTDPGESNSFDEFLDASPDVVVIEWLGCVSEDNQAKLQQFLKEYYEQVADPGLNIWVKR